MGHAHHFLSRLDRLSRAHVDLALALYRDDERLRYLLEQARVPEGAERVAVSLDHPREGPFVLVTRHGRFVTCLGRGMCADNLPIITRAELDAFTAKHVVFQEREAARARLIGADGEAGFVLGRLLDAGPLLAREEFQALAALHPLIGDEYFRTSLEWAVTTRQLQLKLKRAIVKRGARLWPLQLEQLHLYWKLFFAAGHLAVLALSDGGELIHQKAGGSEDKLVNLADILGIVAVDGGSLARTTRCAWTLAHFGETWIPHARRKLHEAKTASDVLAPAFSLIATGARHDELRAEVIEIFSSVPRLATSEAQIWSEFLGPAAVGFLGDIEGVMAAHKRTGAALAVSFREHYPRTSPHHYTRPEDVPDDIAYSQPFLIVNNYARDAETRLHLVPTIIAAARAEPEQLFPPRRCVEFLEQKWEPEHSLLLMEGWLETARKPAPRPAGPTRNGPCPCGSGKKYKRCCATAETT
jgi:hypothetical protein